MAIAINGSGTVTGISVGGLPDGIVDAGTLASNSVEEAKIAGNAVVNAKIAENAVSSYSLATNAVATANIAAEAVTNVKQGPGSVIQFVKAPNSQVSARWSSSSSSTSNLPSYLSFTPTDATNTIVVGGFVNAYVSNPDTYLELRLSDDDGANNFSNYRTWYGGTDDDWNTVSFAFSHTAGSTSAKTYRLCGFRQQGSGTCYTGWSSSPGTINNGNDFWVMEVVA
jgi:hypothetical protein